MKLLALFKSFRDDEAGAVTVDWVVLTAAIVGLGLVVINTVGTGITGMGQAITDDLADRSETVGFGVEAPAAAPPATN